MSMGHNPLLEQLLILNNKYEQSRIKKQELFNKQKHINLNYMDIQKLKSLTDPQHGLSSESIQELKRLSTELIDLYEGQQLRKWAIQQAIASGCYAADKIKGLISRGNGDVISEAQRILDFVTGNETEAV